MALPLKTGSNRTGAVGSEAQADLRTATSTSPEYDKPCVDPKRQTSNKTPTIAKIDRSTQPALTEIDLSELESQLEALKRWIADKKATLR